MKLASNKLALTVRAAIASTFVVVTMSSAAMAEELQYCDQIFSGGDSAYVPCVSGVDQGNGTVVVYDNNGNIVHIEKK
ncbi:MAG: hypothetical protein FJ146_14175 [Deltaproteobacteria bacterium]|nr:hypothetical protein [Deltaproteobacteria bacterium]